MRTNTKLTPCTARCGTFTLLPLSPFAENKHPTPTLHTRCGAFLSNKSIYNFEQSSYKKVEEKTCCLQVFSSSSVQVYNIFVKFQMALGRF